MRSLFPQSTYCFAAPPFLISRTSLVEPVRAVYRRLSIELRKHHEHHTTKGAQEGD